MVQTQNTLRRIYFGPWDHYLNKRGLGPRDKFQAAEPSSSREEDV